MSKSPLPHTPTDNRNHETPSPEPKLENARNSSLKIFFHFWLQIHRGGISVHILDKSGFSTTGISRTLHSFWGSSLAEQCVHNNINNADRTCNITGRTLEHKMPRTLQAWLFNLQLISIKDTHFFNTKTQHSISVKSKNQSANCSVHVLRDVTQRSSFLFCARLKKDDDTTKGRNRNLMDILADSNHVLQRKFPILILAQWERKEMCITETWKYLLEANWIMIWRWPTTS